MLPVKYNTSFVLHRKDEGDVARLEFRVKWNSSRLMVALSVGFVVDPSGWDARAQRCKPKSMHGPKCIPAAVINREAQRYEDSAAAVFASLRDADIWPTATEVRKLLRQELGIDTVERRDLPSAMEEYIRYGSARGWSEGTVKKYGSLLNQLREWDAAADPDTFTLQRLDAFADHLIMDLGMRNSTVTRYAGLLKAFLHWCDTRNMLHCRDYSRWQLSLKAAPQQVVFLTWDELMKVWEWVPDVPWRGRIRDIFCFCAFTSLRFSDAMNLRWSDVTETALRLVSKKDVDGLVIDLNRWSDEILLRHVDEGYRDGRVLPPVTNQVANRELKLIMRELGIDAPVHRVYYKEGRRVDEICPKWELIGTHTARRTFICNALMMGIPATTVMKWTGHSDYNALRPYISVADRERASEMAKFNEKSIPSVSPKG